jgi:hypothetical protein
MTLKTLFAIPIAIILIATLSLAGMIGSQGWSGHARGKAAVEAVGRMRLLLQLQIDLRNERVASTFALGRPYPLGDAAKRQLIDARRGTDLAIRAVSTAIRDNAESSLSAKSPEEYLTAVTVRLGALRSKIDALLVSGESARAVSILTGLTPEMIVIAEMVEVPFHKAGIAVITADPGLAGLVTEDRLAAFLRDRIGQAAAIVVPRFDKGERPTPDEMDKVRRLLAGTSIPTRLLSDTIEFAGATDQIRAALLDLEGVDVNDILRQFEDPNHIEPPSAFDEMSPTLTQKLLLPWAGQIGTLRVAFVNAAKVRVAAARDRNELQFNLVMVAIGAVIIAVLESVVLLSQRVVIPLAHLGQAITRIAGGERGVPLEMPSGTREISEMQTAVETLRQAALVADGAMTRQRVAARQRLELFREALGIARTVQESAHLLERGVARLSEGIDATMEFVATGSATPPPTLGTAADAVRLGLAEMRQSSAALDATFAAVSSAQTEDLPEAEFVAFILAVQNEVDRRSRSVRGFLQPSLVALRDATSAGGSAPEPVLRHLIDDQFARIEETVAVIAAMLSAVTRASAIVRDMPVADTRLAA